jgi:hypothetical protein
MDTPMNASGGADTYISVYRDELFAVLREALNKTKLLLL